MLPSATPPRHGRTWAPAARARAGAEAGTDAEARLDQEESLLRDAPWSTVVWNDPVNLMSYVAYVFRHYFGFSAPVAERLMMQVHEEGRAVVATGPREEMERHVEAMHGFGLWSTVQKGGA